MTSLHLAAALLAVWSQSGQPSPRPWVIGTASIRGRLVSIDGRPLVRAQVRLDRVDVQGTSRRADTDEEGKYEFTNLSSGRYTVTAIKMGYVTLEYGQRRPSERGEPVALRDGETREHVDITLPRTSAIMGRIVDEYGEPIEGATVRAFQIQFSGGRRRLVNVPDVVARSTNDVGRFRIFGLQPGRYIVGAVVGQVANRPTADLPGYGSTYFPGTTNPIEAQLVSVGLSQDVPNVEFALARMPTAKVSGTAFSSTGEPITGGLVLAPSQRSGALVTTPVGARISPGGHFEFPNLVPGEYVVQAYKTRPIPSVEGEFAAELVTVTGTDVGNVDLRMTVGSTITGRFIFEGGGPPNLLDIDFSPVPTDLDLAPVAAGPPARAEIRRENWTFDMAGIHGPRRLRLVRAPEGWSLKSITSGGIDITDRALPFGTRDQSLGDIEVTLTRRASTVTGTVSDARGPVAGSNVVVYASDRTLWYAQSRFLGRATSGSDGAFTIAGLPPGDYFAVAFDRGRATEAGGEWQDPELLESVLSQATSLTLNEGQRVALNLKLITR
jgi:Carboxypeptidase regulatory-like domain